MRYLDGTVPYLSSAIMEQIPTKLPFKKKWITFAADHTEIIKQEKTVNWIMDILKKGYSDQQEDEIIKHDYIVARVACPVDVTVLSGGEFDKTGILKSESKFIGIPITENTVIHTGTNKESGIVLNIDSNGDGTIDKIFRKNAGIKHGNNTIIPDNRKELLQRFVISLLHRINTLKDSSTEHKD